VGNTDLVSLDVNKILQKPLKIFEILCIIKLQNNTYLPKGGL